MKTKIEAPNYTQIPNIYFDEIMQTLNQTENIVFLVIMRKTFGWHKKRDNISYSQIMELTGIKSRTTVSTALKGLLEKGLIETQKAGQLISYTVSINGPVQKINQSKFCTGTSPNSVLVEPKTSPNSVHTKEKNLNKDKENIKECNEGLFLEFYKQYPKKTNKTDARKVFFSLLKQKVTLELILERLNAYKYQINKNNTELQYVRNPARFLRSLEDFEEINVEEEKKEPGIKKKVKLYCKKCGSILEDCVCTQCYALHDMQGELL